MFFAYSGTFAIEDPSITIINWKAVLLDPISRSDAASTNITSDGANPVDWTIEAEDVPFGFVWIMPRFITIWAVDTTMDLGTLFIVDSPDLPFIYKVTDTTGTGNTGLTFPDWPTAPGAEVTHGECTYLCVGRRPQPQIEGPVWGTPA